MSKRKKQAMPIAREVRGDVAARRIIVFSLVLITVLVTVMALQNSSAATMLTFYRLICPTLIPLFAVALALSIVLRITRQRKCVDESGSVLSSSLLVVLSGGLFAAVVGCTFLSATRLLICLIALAVLFYIYYLYPRSFYLYSALTLVGGMALAFFRFGAGAAGIILPVLLLAAVELALLVLLVRGEPLIPQEPRERLPFVLTAAILLVGLVLGFVAPSLLFYAIAILFASFLVIAIINTLRMM